LLPTTFLTIILAVYPVKADMTMRFQDISISQALAAARLVGFKPDGVIIPPEGRIGLLLIEFRGNLVTINASNLNIQRDPIRWIKAVYNRKTEYWSLKAEALGGIIELDGVMPKTIPDEQSMAKVSSMVKRR
jgi:hypothetical protein